MSITVSIKILIILLLAVGVFGQTIYNADGNQFGKSQGKIPSRLPYEVVDTIRMSAGTGFIVLNSHTTKEKHNVKPTSKDNMFISVIQILDYISGASIYNYGAYISDNLDTIILKSSNNTDTSKVHIRIIMK